VHPEILSLRQQPGLARHPAQIVVTGTGSIDVERARLLNVPGVPAFVRDGPERVSLRLAGVLRHHGSQRACETP
jgi:hypothetical protein